MTFQRRKGCPARLAQVSAMVVALLTFASTTWAGGDLSKSDLLKKVRPCVAKVCTDGGLGSGYICDAARGLIVTNAHVIKHAKKCWITFPADGDDKKYPTLGWVAVKSVNDLALVKIDPTQRKLRALDLELKFPEKLDEVYAFGSPVGIEDSVTRGEIAAVRTGKQIDKLFRELGRPFDMGYEPDATWIQHSSPISPGNSGGPLVDTKGNVLGLNTWCRLDGQNLNFAIAAKHIKPFLEANREKEPQKWESLPDWKGAGHDSNPGGHERGDPEKTLAAWKALNRAKIAFKKAYDPLEKKLANIQDPRNRPRGQLLYDKKQADAYTRMSKVYSDCVAKIKGIESTGADTALINHLIIEAEFTNQLADGYKQWANGLLSQNRAQETIGASKVLVFKEKFSTLRIEQDAMRVTFNHMYNLEFPAPDDEEKNLEKGEAGTKSPGDQASGDDSGKTKPGSDKHSTKPDSGNSYRTWTSRDGQHKIKAKLITVEDGKARLERKDGKEIIVPVEDLSEDDQEYINDNS
jgi:hypothetical protein